MDATAKRAQELSRAIVALSKGIEAKKVPQQPKNLDFLNTLTGLNIPKKKKEYKPDVKKNRDYLNKVTGLPIPKKLPEKPKDITFLGNLTGVNHQQISQDAIINKLVAQSRAQIEEIQAQFISKLEDITLQARMAELMRQPPEDIEVTDEMVIEIIKRIKKLPNGAKLDVTDINNYQSFIFKGKRYGIDELMHGGGGGNNGIEGLNTEVNGTFEGLLDTINFLEGDGISLVYSVVAGIPTISFSTSTPPTPTVALAGADISSQATGTNRIFSIPANAGVVGLIGSDAPFVYLQGIDFNVSGTLLTFTSSVVPPSRGSTLVVEYIPENSVVTVASVNLPTDGISTSFTVPASFSSLAVRGSDFPIIYRPLVDYNVSGTTLTLTGVPTPSAGSSLTFIYTTVSASAATVDLSSQATGSNRIFVIPANSSTVSLTGTDSPIIYRPGVDYVVSGPTLTMLGAIPPSAGATLVLTYIPGGGSSPGSTPITIDLTPQVNGSNLVFTVPPVTTPLVLIGSDFPMAYRPGVDYTVSGTTLTLTGVPAPTGTLLFTFL